MIDWYRSRWEVEMFFHVLKNGCRIEKLPDKPPTLNEVVRLVARLGGFLARKGDGEPGVKTSWPSDFFWFRAISLAANKTSSAISRVVRMSTPLNDV